MLTSISAPCVLLLVTSTLSTALNSTVQIKPGETLQLNLTISDRLEVIYSSTDPAAPSSILICRVEKPSVKLSREYSERTSVSSYLELRGVKESDSGNYTVQDILNNEIIHIYTVIVQGVSVDPEARGKEENSGQGAALPGWVVPVLVVLGVVCVVSVVVNVVLLTKPSCLQAGSKRREDHVLNQMEGPNPPSPEEQESRPLQPPPSNGHGQLIVNLT